MALLRNVGLLCALMAMGGTALAQSTQPTSSVRPALLAFGSSDHYWIATVESYKEGNKTLFKTLVRDQTLPAGDWKDMGVPVLGYAIALADSQSELAILLDDGNWKWLGSGGLTTGPAVPGTGPILAWSSAASTLYAVRAVEGGRQAIAAAQHASQNNLDTLPAPATRPATRRTTTAATTSVTTGPSVAAARPPVLVLLRFDKGAWRGVADLPASVKSNIISISGAGSKLLLAAAGQGDFIHTWALTDSKWEGWGEFHTGSRPNDLGVISLGHLPAIWAKDQDEMIKVFVKREGEEWSSLKAFEMPKGLPADAERTVAAPGAEIHVVAMGKDGKVFEQRYDSTGAKRGDLSALPVPQVEHESPIARVMQLTVVLAMVVIMLVTFYKRRSTGPKEEAP